MQPLQSKNAPRKNDNSKKDPHTMHVNCIARLGLILTGIAALGLAVAHPVHAQTIDATGKETFGGGGGFSGFEFAGETFVAPNTQLLDFSTIFNGEQPTIGGTPTLSIYAFNGRYPTGNILFTGTPTTITPFINSAGFTDLTYFYNTTVHFSGIGNPLTGVPLQTGQTYAALFSVAPPFDELVFEEAASNTTDPYAGGQVVAVEGTQTFFENGTTSKYIDLAFKADFGPAAVLTPESSGLANLSGGLLALGAAGLLLHIRRRRVKPSV